MAQQTINPFGPGGQGAAGTGITGITMNDNAVPVNNGIANLGNVAKYVKTTQSAYDALTPKDPNTLYLIPKS